MKPLFLVYVDHPMCSIDCADAIYEVLNDSGIYEAKLIGPNSYPKLDFSEENIQDASCIVMPGGLGDSDQFDYRLYDKKEMIQNYVKKGGKYLGICMGSYFAGHYYFDLLNGYHTKQYIKRKDSTIKKIDHDVVDLYWNNIESSIYFHDGAAFIPVDKKKKDATILARYKNGDVAAMIQNCGKGKIGVVGPHPEAMRWWFYSQRRIRNRWHDCVRHDLMLDLIHKLMNK